ncbi:MAG: PilZ domain-containing protein [Lachnospiraceae bacterium]|nr:PilZ domain-containing protein [Lachnospiraceae bacterium]
MADSKEKRKYKRMELSLKVYMTRVDDEASLGIPVEVLDISRAGIGFACEQELEGGSIYKANIKIWTGDVITAFINVVRVASKNGKHMYGGIFVGMPESDWCRISIYETYQEMEAENNK